MVSNFFRILEQTSSGYIVLDSQNRAQRWNDGYLQLFPWLAPALKVGAPLITTLQAASAALLRRPFRLSARLQKATTR